MYLEMMGDMTETVTENDLGEFFDSGFDDAAEDFGQYMPQNEDNSDADNTTEDTTFVDDMNGTDGQPADTPAGDTGAETGDARAADTTAEAEAEPKNTEDKSEPRYTLKIRGKEQEYGLQDILQLASKGGDYDRVRQGYDEFRVEAMALRELAAERGKSSAELLTELKARQAADKVDKLAGELMENGMDEALARLLAENQITVREMLQAKNQSSPANVAEEEGEPNTEETRDGGADKDGHGEALAESIRKLVAVYGVNELPPEVIQLSVEKQLPPFEAYQNWLLQKAEAEKAELGRQLEQERLNKRNLAKSPGRLENSVGGGKDWFADGMDMMGW